MSGSRVEPHGQFRARRAPHFDRPGALERGNDALVDARDQVGVGAVALPEEARIDARDVEVTGARALDRVERRHGQRGRDAVLGEEHRGRAAREARHQRRGGAGLRGAGEVVQLDQDRLAARSGNGVRDDGSEIVGFPREEGHPLVRSHGEEAARDVVGTVTDRSRVHAAAA